MTRRTRTLPLALLLGSLAALPAGAQPAPGRWSVAVGAWAVPLVTHASPAVAGEAKTEAYLSQPVVMAHAASPGGGLSLLGTLNLEGLTLRRGELSAGIWGEGYVDRRHPHTYLHELVATARPLGGGSGEAEVTLTAGRGFAPFGTDDPMARPLAKFPANHHLSHVLERWMVVAAARFGAAGVEAGAFAGNEPTGAGDVSGLERFGDSWAGRVTLRPVAELELQGSHARVASPDFPPAAESAHRKWSASARWEREWEGGERGYALLEWAWTGEYFSGERAHDFRTVLAEAAVRRGVWEVAGRWERTTRPEEERLSDPFRTPVPHVDVHLLGITRWSIYSVRAELASAAGPLRVRPFAEVARARVRPVLANQFFDPAAHFGDDAIWGLSVGARLEAGTPHRRMGRYGAALPPARAGGGGAHPAGHHE